MLAPLQARGDALSGATDAPAVLVAAYATAATPRRPPASTTATPARGDAGQSFEVGSQTKMMTAVVILQLAAEGLIDLDAAAADYLPGSVTEGIPNAGTATVRQMLAMRSGIPNYTEAVDGNGDAALPQGAARATRTPDSARTRRLTSRAT